MDNATYVTLTRQSGLLQEMQVLANNIANANTTGYRAESLMFSEHVMALDRGVPALSMASARVRDTAMTQGSLAQTGGAFDLAIEGAGFFLVDTPQGPRLTRAGAFAPNAAGDLVTPDGHRLLDAGGAPVFVPAGAGAVGIGADGTISVAGDPIGQIGLVIPVDPARMTRQSGTLFAAQDGFVALAEGRILQGFVENANVNPIQQVSRMIAVQRAYELGQSFLDKEHDRMRRVIDAVRS